jgi:ABC-2 type transport system permease protein
MLVAIGTFTGLALLRGQSTSVDVTSVVFTLFAFGWLTLPLLAFGLDGTLDPATLALYPLRTRPLAVGLLAASAAGAWPLANVLGLLGSTVGLASGTLGVLVAVVAVLLEVLFCITLARFVTTAMASVLRSRRGKDFAAFLFIPIVALYETFTQVVPRLAASGKLTTSSFSGVDSWLRWLPPGLAAHAIQDASTGHLGTALARLALLAAVIVVLGWLWVRSLSRALVTADTSTQSSRVHGKALPFARYGLRGAAAARLWIYQRRDPTALTFWGITAVIMAAVSVSAIIGQNRPPGVLLASAVFGAGFVGVFHANSVGLTGPPFVLEATALTSPARTSPSPRSRYRCSPRSPSAWRTWPSTRPTGSLARPWTWPVSVRPWHCATSSRSRFRSLWRSGSAVPCGRPRAGTPPSVSAPPSAASSASRWPSSR